MEIIKELSRVEVGHMVIRDVIADCSIHGQSKHRDVNGDIDCYECSDFKIQVANAKQLAINRGIMKLLMTAKMIEKGVSLNTGSFDDWQYDTTKSAEQHDKIIQLQQYSEVVDSSSPNLIILGRTGTGKTMLANAIAVNYYLKKEQSLPIEFCSYNQQNFYDHTCQLITSFDIGSQSKARWGNCQESEHDYLRSLAANDLLIIDDLGAGDGYVKDRERISQIINSRYRRSPTVITTNMNIAGLRDFLGDRAWDRLHQNLIVMECNWDSYRAKTANIQIIGAAK